MSEKIEDMIDAIGTKNLVNASDLFQELIQDKMQTALDQEKIAVADSVFNGVELDDGQAELDLGDEPELDLDNDDEPEEPVDQ